MAKPFSKRILIVEDDADIRELLVIRLRMLGCELVVASNGKTGYERLKATVPDLVICDIVMPIEDGLSFCRRVRAEDDRTPFLFLTAKGQAQDIIEVLSAGGDDYIVKPFEPAELLARIQAILRRSKTC